MALKGPTPIDLPVALLTPVEYGSRIRPKIHALHYATWHDTPLIGGSTILEAATGSSSGVGKDLDERVEMFGFRRNAGLVARARRRKELKKKPLGLKKNSTLIISTCHKINFCCLRSRSRIDWHLFDDLLCRLDFLLLEFRVEASDWPDVSTLS